MVDVFTKEKRSDIMSRVRSHGNKSTEIALIHIFRKQGVTGWRRHQSIYGKPDFVFHKLKLAIFVDGCFWHGCLKHHKRPLTNGQFWEDKITRNKKRDRLVNRVLKKNHWDVMRIWEHELKPNQQSRLARRIKNKIMKCMANNM